MRLRRVASCCVGRGAALLRPCGRGAWASSRSAPAAGLTRLLCCFAVDGAKPYPYDSWPQTPKVQVTTGSDAANTVAQIENSLSPNQMQQFQQLQKQQGRKLAQVGAADLATAAGSDQTGLPSAQHLQQVHNTNQNYQQQKNALAQNFQQQQQVLQQQLAAAPAGSPTKESIQHQISTEAVAYQAAQNQLKAQAKSQNTNAQNWVGNVDWAAVPWPSQQQ